MAGTHRYQSHLLWQGSTGTGYAHYSRDHDVATPPAGTELRLSADPAFLGDPALSNPEQLLLAAASSCQLLSFLALAARARIDVVAYEDDAEAIMPADRITRIVLRPQIAVAPGTDVARVHRLVGKAHESCYIANSLNSEVLVEATVEHVGDASNAEDVPAAEARS